MINQTILKILNANNINLADSAVQLEKAGIQNVFNYLSKSDVTKIVFPEQVIKLLCVFHYMIQKKSLIVQVFQECNIYWITNVLNNSFIMERLSTEMSSSSTFAKSIQFSSLKSSQQQSDINHAHFQTESKQQKLHTKRMDCFQSYSEKQQTERHIIREPLSYQQMLQLYYTYLKRVCHYSSSGIPIIELYVIQNICSMGLRIIEGQKCPKLDFCFELILKDLEQFQSHQIDYLKELLIELNNKDNQQRFDLFEIYKLLCLNGKQIKFFGMLNRLTINQQKLKTFKKECKEFVIECKQHLRKVKLLQSQERLSVSEFKTNNNYFEYERKQLYNHY
ncbi:unnamed protein product [Paramecium sonneborni]|uniref:Uncharacterized protein n=1 Tax=Paramecium sonneborni TaxID=65129 RepID=A0A8S1NSH0_9CILI|nr:unnamed protein product [Paramecium sonneborni]